MPKSSTFTSPPSAIITHDQDPVGGAQAQDRGCPSRAAEKVRTAGS
jgi:hypothetical protein